MTPARAIVEQWLERTGTHVFTDQGDVLVEAIDAALQAERRALYPWLVHGEQCPARRMDVCESKCTCGLAAALTRQGEA